MLVADDNSQLNSFLTTLSPLNNTNSSLTNTLSDPAHPALEDSAPLILSALTYPFLNNLTAPSVKSSNGTTASISETNSSQRIHSFGQSLGRIFNDGTTEQTTAIVSPETLKKGYAFNAKSTFNAGPSKHVNSPLYYSFPTSLKEDLNYETMINQKNKISYNDMLGIEKDLMAKNYIPYSGGEKKRQLTSSSSSSYDSKSNHQMNSAELDPKGGPTVPYIFDRPVVKFTLVALYSTVFVTGLIGGLNNYYDYYIYARFQIDFPQLAKLTFACFPSLHKI